MPSLVQRFGRAARDRNLQGFGILYAPPISKAFPTDKNVREYLMNQAGGCLWTIIDKLFENRNRNCNNSCSGCFKVERPVPTTVCLDTKSTNRRRVPKRSKEDKDMALKVQQAWRKEAYDEWASRKPYRIGGETWILPDNAAKPLSEKFSRVRTAEDVGIIASSCNWTPLTKDAFKKVAEVLHKLNNEIDACRVSESQTTVISAPDQSESSSDGDEEENDGDGELPGY